MPWVVAGFMVYVARIGNVRVELGGWEVDGPLGGRVVVQAAHC